MPSPLISKPSWAQRRRRRQLVAGGRPLRAGVIGLLCSVFDLIYINSRRPEPAYTSPASRLAVLKGGEDASGGLAN